MTRTCASVVCVCVCVCVGWLSGNVFQLCPGFLGVSFEQFLVSIRGKLRLNALRKRLQDTGLVIELHVKF